MPTDRPGVRRRNVFGPPQEVRAVMASAAKPAKPRTKATRNAKAQAPIVLEAPAKPRLSAVPATPVRERAPVSADLDAFDLTQQDAADLVFALGVGLEDVNANVQRWQATGDQFRTEAALMQAQRFEHLRARIAGLIPRLARKG